MLHGWGSSIEPWRVIMNALSQNHRVVALDFPGCGKSDILKEPWNTEDYANFVLKFMKLTNLKNPVLVGHSNGGRVIMKMCGEKMFSPPKIIFIDAAGIKAKKSFKKQFKIKTFKTVKWCLTRPIIKKYTANLLAEARNYFGSADYNSAPEVMRKTMVTLINEDMTPIVHNINCPTLLLWGDKDADTPLYMAHTLERLIKDTGLCVLTDTGHFSFVQKPYEAVAIIKSFLG